MTQFNIVAQSFVGGGETSLDDEQILVLDLLKKLLPKMGQDEVSAVSFFLNRQIDGEKDYDYREKLYR